MLCLEYFFFLQKNKLVLFVKHIELARKRRYVTIHFILEWTTCLYTSFYGFTCVYVRDCVQVIPAYPPGGDTSAGSFGNGRATSVT